MAGSMPGRTGCGCGVALVNDDACAGCSPGQVEGRVGTTGVSVTVAEPNRLAGVSVAVAAPNLLTGELDGAMLACGRTGGATSPTAAKSDS